MQLNTESIFDGLSWKEVSEGSGVDAGTLSRVKHGRMGLSVKAAQAVGPQIGISATAIYAATQATAVARKKSATGEATPSHTLSEVGRVLKALQDHFGGDLDRSDGILDGAIKVLGAVAEKALKDEPALAGGIAAAMEAA